MKDANTSPPAAGAAANSPGGTTLYEGLSVELVPAPFLKRYLAFAVDMGIISAILYAFFIVLMLAAGALFGVGFALKGVLGALRDKVSGLETAGVIGLVLLLAVVLLVLFVAFDGYFIWFEYKKGTTPGKGLFGMRVVSLRGPRLTLGQCLIREAFRLLDCLLIFPGVLSIAATDRRQRLGDLVAGAMVVYSARKERSDEYLYISQDRYHALVEEYTPETPPAEACAQYLAFAYGEYILRRQVSPEGLLEQWDGFVRRYLTSAEKLDRQTRLLFFGEICFQTTNGNPPRRQGA